ncbi:hypothetical protein DFH08DRAFT_975891 [Mycena albidolilacea]|uniref:Uncharacterized protein n=1 Tax=Mycena albidolilacea TaxID=1033008 RepID=A0AAD6Z518_9AGAR|nr:hypothetical protein DFH08DRAFT_975891 [Mycena albidolilacea]
MMTYPRQKYCIPDLSPLSPAPSMLPAVPPSESDNQSTSPTVSSVTTTTWDEVPDLVRFFALWGGHIVFTDRIEAKNAFLQAEAEGLKPRILSTEDYDEAQAFSEQKRPRHKKGTPKANPGKLSWVHGTKKLFFERRQEEWLREAEKKRAGAFYTKIAKLYLKKYGYHLGDNQDLAVDIADPPDSAADEVIHEQLSDSEQQFRAEYLKTLKTRIGQWYRAEYGALLKCDKSAFKDLFTGVLNGAPPKPQRGRILHFYSRKYYATRIRQRVDERVESLKRRARFAGETVAEAERMPIDVVAKVTSEVWAEETPAFQRECEVAMEEEYQKVVKAWEMSLADSPTRTAEEIAATLDNAAFYLQPFVDAIQERFGMCASILLAGPIGIRGGRIGVQSVHAGTTRGLAPVNWPAFDWKGFQEAEKSMISFASECYSATECRLRAVEAGDSGSSLSDVPSPAIPSMTTSTATPAAVAETLTCTGPQAAERTVPASASTADNEAAVVTATLTRTGSPAVEMTAPASASAADNEAAAVTTTLAFTGPQAAEIAPASAGATDNEERNGAEAGAQMYDEYWSRDDQGMWTEELARAHAAFEQGREWGLEWAVCVQKFFDFEGECGFADGGRQMPRKLRPVQVGGWISRGRKWRLPPALGSELGTREDDLWVGRWWKWWTSLQPKERAEIDGEELLRPETADWSDMAGMYGKNGLLQVMATLVWWGEVAVGKQEADAKKEWVTAVSDVTWVLEQMLNSGEIKIDDGQGAKRKRKGGSGASEKKNVAEDDEGPAEEEGEPQRKKKRCEDGPANPLRRANRLRGAAPDDFVDGRRTRSKSG